MKPLRTVAFFGLPYPTPYDLLQARRMVAYHLLHGNWRILVHQSDALLPTIEHWCTGRLYTVYTSRSRMLAEASRVVAISRPDMARLAVCRGRETWLIDEWRQIIPRPLWGA